MEPQPCRILLVDDHPLILSGIAALLREQADLELVGSATSMAAAVHMVASLRPDLVIVDGTLPDGSGMALIRHLLEDDPGLLTLALTLHEDGAYIRDFLAAGARGVVLKRSAADQLLLAIRAVLANGVYVDPGVASKIVMQAVAKAPTSGDLSTREESVVRYIAQGYSNKEVSRLLSISVKTVETYRARACEKLGINSRSSLVRTAIDRGWLQSSMSGQM